MTLTKEEKELIKLLVRKELKHIEKEKKGILEINAPFLSEVLMRRRVLRFMKNEKEYQLFLKGLLRKLR